MGVGLQLLGEERQEDFRKVRAPAGDERIIRHNSRCFSLAFSVVRTVALSPPDWTARPIWPTPSPRDERLSLPPLSFFETLYEKHDVAIFSCLCVKTNRRMDQGILSGLLSAPYVVQRLGDFDPGLEFKTAMVYADPSVRPGSSTAGARGVVTSAAGGGEAGPGECSVVLGDRDVQETLRRLGGALTALTGGGEGGDEKEGVGRGEGAPEGASSRAGGGGVGVGMMLDNAEVSRGKEASFVVVVVVVLSGRGTCRRFSTEYSV